MAKLWQKFADRYGQKWANAYSSPTALTEWGNLLADMTLDQIGIGFVADGGRRSPWPPSGPEFVGLCAGEAELDTASVLADVITWLEPPHRWASDISFSVVKILGQSNVKAMKLDELKRALPAAIKAVKRNGLSQAPKPTEQEPADPSMRISGRTGPKQTETGYAWIRQIREEIGLDNGAKQR